MHIDKRLPFNHKENNFLRACNLSEELMEKVLNHGVIELLLSEKERKELNVTDEQMLRICSVLVFIAIDLSVHNSVLLAVLKTAFDLQLEKFTGTSLKSQVIEAIENALIYIAKETANFMNTDVSNVITKLLGGVVLEILPHKGSQMFDKFTEIKNENLH